MFVKYANTTLAIDVVVGMIVRVLLDILTTVKILITVMMATMMMMTMTRKTIQVQLLVATVVEMHTGMENFGSAMNVEDVLNKIHILNNT